MQTIRSLLRLAIRARNASLLLGGVFAGFVYFALWNESFVSDLSAGLIASFLVIIFVEGALEEERQGERIRVAKVALQLMKRPVTRMLSMLAGWYKAAMQEPLHPVPATMEDVFDDRFYETLFYFDMQSPAPVIPSRNWLAWSSEQVAEFQADVDDIINKYATFLTPQQIEVIEEASQCSMLNLVQTLHNARLPQVYRSLKMDLPKELRLFEDTDELLRAFVKALLKLREELASVGIEAGTVASLMLDDPKNPPVGSGRAGEAPVQKPSPAPRAGSPGRGG